MGEFTVGPGCTSASNAYARLADGCEYVRVAIDGITFIAATRSDR